MSFRIVRMLSRMTSGVARGARSLAVVAAACLLPLLLLVASSASPAAALQCSDFNDGLDGPYWNEVANCTGCARQVGCGYCLSTLSCVAGDDVGPSDFSPCPEWVYEEPECPIKPTCEQYSDCGSCAGISDCVSLGNWFLLAGGGNGQ